MSQIGVFTPEQARMLWQDYLQRQQLSPQLTRNYPLRAPLEEPATHRVMVKNTESEVIPPYACMRVTGTEEVAGRTVITVEKPTSVSGEFLFNSQFEIPVYAEATESTPEVTGVGWAYRYGIVVMLGDGVTTTAGARYRPVVDEWFIESGDGPFVVYGDHNADTDTVIGRIDIDEAVAAEDVGNCACVVGVGVHDPDESPPFYHPSCHRWIPKGVAAVLNEVPGISGLTDDDLVLTRHDTDPHWDSAIFERECPGMSGVTTDYVLILEQEANGWHLYTDVASGSSENCDDTLDWHWKSP